MKFQDYLIESWKDYKLSNSPKVLLYDFYLLSYLSSLILDPGTRKEVGLTGVGYSGKFFGREGKELDEDIQYIASPGWLDKVMAMKPITYKTSEDHFT